METKQTRPLWLHRLLTGLRILSRFLLLLPIPVFMVWFSYNVDRSGLFQGDLAPREVANLLLESKDVVWQGQWKTFREMPWGEMYIKPYTGRVLTRAAFTFGTRLPAFKAACEKMQALPMKHGDAGYQFDLIGGYRMQILVWEGDDEFPPNAQVLYSDNFAEGFAAEDRVVAGDILISTIKSQM